MIFAPSIRKWAVTLFGVVGASAVSPAARADDRVQCISLAERGQVEHQEGKLESSRRDFLRCSSESCPRMVRDDCLRWLAEVEGAMPTVVFFATDSRGRDLVDVRVDLDGAPLLSRLDGRSVRVDPGQHHLAFSTAGGQVLHQTYLFVQGEHDRKIAIHFDSAAPSSEALLASPPSETAPVGLFVSGGVAVAGLASFTIFGLSAKNGLATLDDSRCAPTCDPAEVDHIRTKMIVADVSLAVGVVSLGIFAYFLARGSGASSAPRGHAELPSFHF